MPAIRVLGCCSRLGTWSTACRRAGFLQLSSKTCRHGASGFLRAAGPAGPAEDAAGIAWSTVPCLVPAGPGAGTHGRMALPASASAAPRRAVALTCASWRGAVMAYLERLCCEEPVRRDVSVTPAISLCRKPGICRISSFCPAEERGGIGGLLCCSALNIPTKCIPKTTPGHQPAL